MIARQWLRQGSILTKVAVGRSDVSLIANRSFHTSRQNEIMDTLRSTFTNIKDRGLRALGKKTSEDKALEQMIEQTQPKEPKSIERLYRKRWSAPQRIVNPITGEIEERITEHKYSTANFRISPRKLQLLADQIGSGKPLDYAILQMQFSEKRAAKRVKSTLAVARDHAIAKGLDPARLVVAEAWVGKGRTHKRRDIKGRGRTGMLTKFEAKLSVVLREGKTHQQKFAEKLEKEKRIARSIGTGGVVRVNRPIINTHQRPGWHW
jgi:large subunit ribosomal protein L22